MSNGCPDQKKLDEIFPPEKSDAFFDAIYGDISEGAYDIRLVCKEVSEEAANMAFELNRRPDKCLMCQLTYGLPEVFQKHPIIDLAGTSRKIADLLGWKGGIKWQLGFTREISEDQNIIPYIITPEKS